MNFTQHDFIRSKVEAGDLSSENEAINQSNQLPTARENDWRNQVSKAVERGVEDIAQGKVLSADDSVSLMAAFKATQLHPFKS